MKIETASDFVILLTGIGGLFVTIMSAIRLSKCYYIDCCKGFVILKRKVKSPNRENSTTNDEDSEIQA